MPTSPSRKNLGRFIPTPVVQKVWAVFTREGLGGEFPRERHGKAWVALSDTVYRDAVPSYLVPDSAIANCEHAGKEWCYICGSYYDGSRWHRPRFFSDQK